jgi:hypothetical protein
MKGKGFSIVFGSLALCGLILILVGALLGGQFGYYALSGGKFVYVSPGGILPLTDAPAWISALGRNAERPQSARPSDTSPETNSGIQSIAAPFGDGQLEKLKIRISAGDVTVRVGDAWGLEVDGPLTAESYFEDGVWEVRSLYDSVAPGFLKRFFLNGADVTTRFTLTVPSGFETLDIEVGMGKSSVAGLKLEELVCATDMGRTQVRDITARRAEFKVDMGQVTVTGLVAESCELTCGMGDIELVNGEIGTLLSVDCGMGNVNATLRRPASYGYSVQVGLGNVQIDGVSCVRGEGGTQSGNGGETPFFELECGMGNVTIRFK